MRKSTARRCVRPPPAAGALDGRRTLAEGKRWHSPCRPRPRCPHPAPPPPPRPSIRRRTPPRRPHPCPRRRRRRRTRTRHGRRCTPIWNQRPGTGPGGPAGRTGTAVCLSSTGRRLMSLVTRSRRRRRMTRRCMAPCPRSHSRRVLAGAIDNGPAEPPQNCGAPSGGTPERRRSPARRPRRRPFRRGSGRRCYVGLATMCEKAPNPRAEVGCLVTATLVCQQIPDGKVDTPTNGSVHDEARTTLRGSGGFSRNS